MYAPHPFDPSRTSLGEGAWTGCAAAALDVVEVFNSKISDPALNRRAAEFAAAYGLPAAAGSDAHDPQGVGAAWVEMPDFDGPRSSSGAAARARVHGEYRPHVG